MQGNNRLYALIIHKGDQKAFERLYYNLVDHLFKVSISITSCREASEEIINDLFVKLWNIRAEKRKIRNIDAFLSISVRNRSLDFLRKKSKYSSSDLTAVEYLSSIPNPHDGMEYDELKEKVDQAILTLPPKCKMIFELVRMYGFSYKQAADEMSVTPKTIENQLRIAVKKILEYLKKEYQSIEKMAS